MAYEGKFADAGKITGVANGVTFTYPGHHVLVRDLLGHPIYGDFFLKLSTTIDPSSINPASSGTGRLYYDVGNRIDNSINLQPSQGVGTYDVNGNLVHANNHPGYSNFQMGVEINGVRKPGLADDIVAAFQAAGGVLPNPNTGDKGFFPEAAMKAASNEMLAYSNALKYALIGGLDGQLPGDRRLQGPVTGTAWDESNWAESRLGRAAAPRTHLRRNPTQHGERRRIGIALLAVGFRPRSLSASGRLAERESEAPP